MFELRGEPLCADALKAGLAHPDAGGYAAFEGWVRRHNEGRDVVRLEYEAYAELAEKEGARIIAEAKERFGVISAACVHRVGTLEIGDMAVWAGVCSAHRAEAFAACRYIIDEIKHRAAIWKKEYYADGDSGWVNCERCAAHGHGHAYAHGRANTAKPAFAEEDLYERQMTLAEVGEEGQQRLKSARILVVGAGGLGSPALLYLAAAGVGVLGICEGDTLEPSNLHRQVLYGHAGVGKPKAALAAERVRETNPYTEVRVHDAALTPENGPDLFQKYDMILDCTDGFAVKWLINDLAVRAGVPAVFASVYQYEGQLQVYDPAAPGPCLRCLWPETPQAGCVGTCADVGILGVVPGVFGALQAMEALKHFLGLSGGLKEEVLLMNLLTLGTQKFKAPRNPACPVCAGAPSRGATAEIAAKPPAVNGGVEVGPGALWDPAEAPLTVVDLREAHERAPGDLGVERVLHMPGSAWDLDSPPLDPEDRYVLCCVRGVRSRMLAGRLRQLGYPHVYSLRGGTLGLRKVRAAGGAGSGA